ncbi:hypothetical protein R1sor_000794 [Riccia sorocarpa]|uniref:NB-ARC domain-containing protein n=1 Tax=Riccia sorocarpa TaxID=122646 RepID=A0ABD3GU45_9MARC
MTVSNGSGVQFSIGSNTASVIPTSVREAYDLALKYLPFEMMKASGRRDSVLVPESSSRLGDDLYIPVQCDHFSICRPTSEKCNRYLYFVALLDTVHQKQKEKKRRYIQPDDILVGVDALLSTILDRDLKEYRFLGLWGTGGVGKTTMAKLVFDELHDEFEYSCFVEDLKSIPGGKRELRQEIWGTCPNFLPQLPFPTEWHVNILERKVHCKHVVASYWKEIVTCFRWYSHTGALRPSERNCSRKWESR